MVKKISSFLGKDLTEEQLDNVVKHSTFKNMKKIPQASYEQVSGDLFNHSEGVFMRKGGRPSPLNTQKSTLKPETTLHAVIC